MKRAAIKHPTHFHPLTQNTIKAFKSRAQAVFSFLKKPPPPPPPGLQIYIISTQGKLYIKNWILIAVLRN
jgi:hypothetical protein